MWCDLGKRTTWWKFDVMIYLKALNHLFPELLNCFLYVNYRLLMMIRNKEKHNNFTLIFWFLQNYPVRHMAGFPRSHHKCYDKIRNVLSPSKSELSIGSFKSHLFYVVHTLQAGTITGQALHIHYFKFIHCNILK